MSNLTVKDLILRTIKEESVLTDELFLLDNKLDNYTLPDGILKKYQIEIPESVCGDLKDHLQRRIDELKSRQDILISWITETRSLFSPDVWADLVEHNLVWVPTPK